MILPLLTDHCLLGTSLHVKKEQRGVMATQSAAIAAGAKTFTAVAKNACSIDAMLNGRTCEALPVTERNGSAEFSPNIRVSRLIPCPRLSSIL